MADRDRDEGGRFQSDVSDDEILSALREIGTAGTADVAEAVGLTRQSADRRLRKLEDNGTVRSTKIGGSLAWSVASE